jgi:hypothetical protein
MLDLLSAMSGDLLAHQFVTGAEHLASGLIAQPDREIGGTFDIREEDGNGAFWKFLRHGSQTLTPTLQIIPHSPGIVKG